MNIYPLNYYHLYNRSINSEILFLNRDNYIFFLKKFRYHLSDFVNFIGYCLMPTHFHFLIYIKSENIEQIKQNIGTILRSYTRAFNLNINRTGSLFQQHTKTKLIKDDKYLITLLTYIHQNPIRSNLVNKAEDWEFSSYMDYIDMRKGTLLQKDIILRNIKKEELIELSLKPIIIPAELMM